MSPSRPSAAQRAEARHICDRLRQAADGDLRQMAELLAGKPDAQLLGAAEFEVRERVRRIGAKAIQPALAEREKGGT
jgi:hypothetical protein